MATKNENEKANVTGIAGAKNPKEKEFDLVTALLSAAEYKEDEDLILECDIKRNGNVLFSVRVHPLSDKDFRFARKKATTYMKDPRGKGLPPIEKEFNGGVFNSWIIYLATTDEDQERIWGNPEIMKKYSLQQPWESVDVLLTFGEKSALVDKITEASGLNDDEYDEDENENLNQETYAKN